MNAADRGMGLGLRALNRIAGLELLGWRGAEPALPVAAEPQSLG